MRDNTSYLERIVDKQALESYLEKKLGKADEFEIRHHGEGHSNETLFVTWADTELVVRRPPPGETADTAHDVLREYRVIDSLQDTAVRVPTTVAACEDNSVLGSDFYVMAKQDGDVLRLVEPDRFAKKEYRQAIGTELVDRLVEIHQVDVEESRLESLGYPEEFTARQVDRWKKQFEWAFQTTAAERRIPSFHQITNWLQSNIPREGPHTLIHGDYKLDNVMFEPGTPPKVGSVFDWELSTLGDPFTDLGWMLSFWWDPKDPEPLSSTGDLHPTLMAEEGYLTRKELVTRYEEQTGWTFDNERFYRVLAVYKLGALGEMFFRRHLEENSDDPLYPEMREGVPELTDRAMRIIDGEEPL